MAGWGIFRTRACSFRAGQHAGMINGSHVILFSNEPEADRAFLADVPHTRPVSVTGIASDASLVDRLGFEGTSYEGPTGITGVLHHQCAAAGLPAVGDALRRPPQDVELAPSEVTAADPFGEDVQLALHVCYELHYRGFAGVDPGWEWEPGLLRLRAALEGVFLAAIRERVATSTIRSEGALTRVQTDAGEFLTRALVITAGHGTNDVLASLDSCTLHVPLAKDRPSEAKYFVPPAATRGRFTAGAMPAVAYLDTGIYCHPIVDGLVEAVKIGYYNPPDMPRSKTAIDSIQSFVEQCAPGLRDADVSDVEDVDQCDYDLVADDDFVLGAVPGVANAFVGVGWRGTGYKFAPWVGRVLAELAVQGATVYDIARFDPGRFITEGRTDDASVATDPAAASQ